MQLELIKLDKSFGAKRVLNDISFKIEPGEIFGFVGANGAGKSTTMRMIMGVLSIDKGEVKVDGHPITHQDRQKIGYMPSDRGLYAKMMVREQLEYLAQIKGVSPKDAREQVNYWMDFLGISEYAKTQLSALSTGNAQRAQLVAALVGNPELLILDEPFSGLDPIAVHAMSEAFREAKNRGMSILFSSHQLELIDQLSDQIGIIGAGQMLRLGTPDELRREADAPATKTIPTPLADIFADLIKES